MSYPSSNVLTRVTAVLLTTLFFAGCSSSSSPDAEGDTPTTGSNPINPGQNPLEDPSTTDPIASTSTTVNFEITVPAYSSDALQVSLIWGDENFTASWIGDEFWTASREFPLNTENLLTVTFYDENGEIPLASYEATLNSGSDDLLLVTITAEQFNSDTWDSDGDGISNIDELIAGTNPLESPQLLLFSETRGFRHPSIESALRALEELAETAGIQTTRAGDSEGVFTSENLARYDAVAWVLTSGNVLNDDEQAAFEHYIQSGAGYTGIHAASDTEYDWPWYGSLVGAYFARHPTIQSATQNVEDGTHISTTHLGTSWTRTDEWYDFRSNPRALVNVLLTLDENTYSGGQMGADHPSAWYHEFDGGRSWYTAGGHTIDSYDEPDFRAHLLGGMKYAVGQD